MILLHHVELPEWLSLVVIAGLLAGGVLLSIVQERRTKSRAPKKESINADQD